MPVVVFSPHTDDAIFSIGAHMLDLDEVTVVSPMAAIPPDPAGRTKHETLRAEHRLACDHLGLLHVEGPFFDDVYPPARPRDVAFWMKQFLGPEVIAYIPFGIHHPDHLLVSDLLIRMLPDTASETIRFYEELPYRIDHPAKASDRFDHIREVVGPLVGLIDPLDHTEKRTAVELYASQVDASVLRRVMVAERVWALM